VRNASKYDILYLVNRKGGTSTKQNQEQRFFLYHILCFLFLCVITAYRQIGRHWFPQDPNRPTIVFLGYMILLGIWCVSIRSRITQKSMRNFLYAEITVMSGWVILRFLQDAFFHRHMHLMRQSGFLIVVPMVLIPTLGVFASYCLGQNEDYRIPPRMYLLLIPDLILTLLMLTNSYHGIMVRTERGKPEDLSFHANYGVSVIIVWAVGLILARLIIIYRKSINLRANTRYRLLPFIVGALMPISVIPYLFNNFEPNAKYEFIEMTIKLFYIEAMTWESCILLGMVPVNTQYRTTFERSTVGMQIVTEEGSILAASRHAYNLSPAEFKLLKQEGILYIPSGCELHLHRLQNSLLIFRQDVSALHAVIGNLKKTAEELEKESDLLREELKTISEKAQIEAQNRIYDRITNEVGSQLEKIRDLTGTAMNSEDNSAFLQICVLGTYIKRRCSLRLTEQATGRIPIQDLRLSIGNLFECFRAMHTKCEIIGSPPAAYPSEFSLLVFDLIELCAESAGFAMDACSVRFEPDRKVIIECAAGQESAAMLHEQIRQRSTDSFPLQLECSEHAFRITAIEKEENANAQINT